MRIVGGKFKGRKLVAPEGLTTRPTSDRARASIFDVLEHQPWGRKALRDGIVLDAFSGTGAMGLEAFSRGAASVTFMDKDEQAMKSLHANSRNIAERGVLSALRVDVTAPPKATKPCSLVFMDAPYQAGVSSNALIALVQQGWIASETICLVETSKKDPWDAPAGFELIDQRKYGAAKIHFLRYA